MLKFYMCVKVFKISYFLNPSISLNYISSMMVDIGPKFYLASFLPTGQDHRLKNNMLKFYVKVLVVLYPLIKLQCKLYLI